MTGYSERLLRTAVVAALCLAPAGGALAQFKPPEAPKIDAPKPPEVKGPEVPEAPAPPEIPGGEEKKPPAPKVPMRKVLDHKKQFVVYPRMGYLQVLGGPIKQPGIGHATVGFDLQIGFKQKFFLSAESHLLYIQSGDYGVTRAGSGENTSLYRFAQGDFTGMAAVGGGLFTHFLDKQELWTHVGVKVGYLYPFFVPIFLSGDIEKEFRRTRTSYWTISLAPSFGVLIPVRDALTQDIFFPDPNVEQTAEGSGLGVSFMAGAQLSLAFIFAPRS